MNPRKRTVEVCKKRVVLGTPVTNREEFNKLSNVSFCVSFYNRAKLGLQLEDCMRIVNESGDQILMIDNGAFSAHMAGIELDEAYWEQFALWASNIMDRCPSAVAVIPDVIGGTEAQNDDLSDWFFQMCEDKCIRIDPERTMAVWHLHESMERLWDLAGAHRYVAFGSSGQYLDASSLLWQDRIREAFDTVNSRAETFDEPRCWIHMMKFQSELKNFDFDSSDSTNFAANAHRFKKHGEGYLKLVADRLKLKHTGSVDSSSQPERTGAENPTDLTSLRRFDSIGYSPLSDAFRKHGAGSTNDFWAHFFHTAWADLAQMDCPEIDEALIDLLHLSRAPSCYDLLVEVNSVYKWMITSGVGLSGRKNDRLDAVVDFLSVYASPFDQRQLSKNRVQAPSAPGEYRAMAKAIKLAAPSLTGSLGLSYKPRKAATQCQQLSSSARPFAQMDFAW